MMALINSWVLLEVLKYLESDRFRLFGGIKGKKVWIILVKTFVIEDFLFYLNGSLVKFDLYFVKGIFI